MNIIIRTSLALSIFLATHHACAQYNSADQSIANQPNKTIMLKPNDGIELATVVGFVRSFNSCMTNVQQTLQQNNASRKRNAYKNARNNQCKAQYKQLKQSINRKSLKAINKMARKRWNQREVGPGFAPENISQISTAFASGVMPSASITNAPANHNPLKNGEVKK